MKAIYINPNKKDYHYLAGLAYEMKRNPEASLSFFEAALRCDSTYVPAKYHAALLYHQLGHLKNALNLFSSVSLMDDSWGEGAYIGQSVIV